MNARTHIEIVLRAAKLAQCALEFLDTQDKVALRILLHRLLIEFKEFKEFIEAVE
jgi:hypothetical protein